MTALREEQRGFTAAAAQGLAPAAVRAQRRRIGALRLAADLLLARAVAQMRGIAAPPPPSRPPASAEPRSCR